MLWYRYYVIFHVQILYICQCSFVHLTYNTILKWWFLGRLIKVQWAKHIYIKAKWLKTTDICYDIILCHISSAVDLYLSILVCPSEFSSFAFIWIFVILVSHYSFAFFLCYYLGGRGKVPDQGKKTKWPVSSYFHIYGWWEVILG